MSRRHLLLVPLALFFAFSSQAQNPLSRSELGISLGIMNYIGDLNNQSMFGLPDPAGELYLRYSFSDRWALRLSGAYGHLHAGNPDAIELRNLSFRSYLWEGNLRAEFNFVPFQHGGKGFKTTPFIFGGLGFFFFNPQALYTNPSTGESSWVDLQPLCTEGQGSIEYPDRKPYSRSGLVMPFGVGVKMLLGNHVAISLEYGFRKTWTDYVDDVSTTYVGEAVLRGSGSNSEVAVALADRSGEIQPGYLNAPGIKRGDASLDDWYAFLNFSVALDMDFLFGWMRSKKCEIY